MKTSNLLSAFATTLVSMNSWAFPVELEYHKVQCELTASNKADQYDRHILDGSIVVVQDGQSVMMELQPMKVGLSLSGGELSMVLMDEKTRVLKATQKVGADFYFEISVPKATKVNSSSFDTVSLMCEEALGRAEEPVVMNSVIRSVASIAQNNEADKIAADEKRELTRLLNVTRTLRGVVAGAERDYGVKCSPYALVSYTNFDEGTLKAQSICIDPSTKKKALAISVDAATYPESPLLISNIALQFAN